jgi:Chemotaxis response regulator containing a CheY-like receiver domain and a methylesterase domain
MQSKYLIIMKIAIVNDLGTAVETLRSVLMTVPEYNIIWIAKNGAEAVAKCAHNTPDLILMDLIMPVMDGVEATREIMKYSPCAIFSGDC